MYPMYTLTAVFDVIGYCGFLSVQQSTLNRSFNPIIVLKLKTNVCISHPLTRQLICWELGSKL